MSVSIALGVDAAKQGESAGVDTKLEKVPDAKSNSTSHLLQHEPFSLPSPDMAVLSATIDKHYATRNLFIPILAEHLKISMADDDLHEVFLKTTNELRDEVPSQYPEYRTTLRHRLCLKKVFNEKINYFHCGE